MRKSYENFQLTHAELHEEDGDPGPPAPHVTARHGDFRKFLAAGKCSHRRPDACPRGKLARKTENGKPSAGERRVVRAASRRSQDVCGRPVPAERGVDLSVVTPTATLDVGPPKWAPGRAGAPPERRDVRSVAVACSPRPDLRNIAATVKLFKMEVFKVESTGAVSPKRIFTYRTFLLTRCPSRFRNVLGDGFVNRSYLMVHLLTLAASGSILDKNNT